MGDLDPALIEKLNKMGIVVDANTASVSANSKVAKSGLAQVIAEQLARKQLINNLKTSLQLGEKEATQLAERMKAQADYDEAEEKREKDRKERSEKARANFKKSVAAIDGFVSSSIGASQSIYNSSKSYSAVIPTLNLVSDTVTGLIEAFGKMASGVEVAGFSLGRYSEGAAQVVVTGAKIAVGVAKQQIENAQKFVDSYTELSKAGVTFGGAIEDMRKSAVDGGMSIDSYSNFIKNNIGNLNDMGGSLEMSAARVTKLGNTIQATDKRLLGMYGSYEALQSATADYVAMQSRYGIDITKNEKQLEIGAKEYLYAQKELTALTGKSAEALKKSEEERQKSAAYQIAMSRMEPQQRENARRALELTQKNYGDIAEKYAREFIATNGHVTSEAALQFKSMYPEVAGTVEETLAKTNQSKEDFNKNAASIIETHRDAIRKEVEQKEDLYKLQAGGVESPYLTMANDVGAAILKSYTSQGEIVKTTAKLEEDRNKQITTSMENFAKTIDSLETYKKKMDERTEANLKNVSDIVNKLYTLQTRIDDMFGDKLSSAVNLFISGLTKAATMLGASGPGAGAGASGTAESRIAGNQEVMNQAGTGKTWAEKAKSWFAAVGAGAANESELGVGDLENLDDIIKFTGTTGDRAHFEKLSGDVKQQFIQMAKAYHDATGKQLQINSSYRDEKEQADVNSGNNPKALPGHSKHQQGRAIDINSDQVSFLATKGLLKQFGFSPLDGDPPHIQMAANGTTLGAGDTAIVGERGPEIINGSGSVTSTAASSEIFSRMVDKLEELVDLMESNNSTSEKILQAQA